MAKRRKGKNSLIDSISAQSTVQQEPDGVRCEISASNEQLESKTEYESLVNDIENNTEFDLQDPKYYVQEDSNAKVPESLSFASANDTTIAELSSANLKLQSENAALQEENDKYLMKISELTFENAKLNAQVQELSKNAANSTNYNSIAQEQSKNVKCDTCNPYRVNGYTSWN